MAIAPLDINKSIAEDLVDLFRECKTPDERFKRLSAYLLEAGDSNAFEKGVSKRTPLYASVIHIEQAIQQDELSGYAAFNLNALLYNLHSRLQQAAALSSAGIFSLLSICWRGNPIFHYLFSREMESGNIGQRERAAARQGNEKRRELVKMLSHRFSIDEIQALYQTEGADGKKLIHTLFQCHTLFPETIAALSEAGKISLPWLAAMLYESEKMMPKYTLEPYDSDIYPLERSAFDILQFIVQKKKFHHNYYFFNVLLLFRECICRLPQAAQKNMWHELFALFLLYKDYDACLINNVISSSQVIINEVKLPSGGDLDGGDYNIAFKRAELFRPVITRLFDIIPPEHLAAIFAPTEKGGGVWDKLTLYPFSLTFDIYARWLKSYPKKPYSNDPKDPNAIFFNGCAAIANGDRAAVIDFWNEARTYYLSRANFYGPNTWLFCERYTNIYCLTFQYMIKLAGSEALADFLLSVPVNLFGEPHRYLARHPDGQNDYDKIVAKLKAVDVRRLLNLSENLSYPSFFVGLVSTLFSLRLDNALSALFDKVSDTIAHRLIDPLMRANHPFNLVHIALQRGSSALKELVFFLRHYFNDETVKIWLVDNNKIQESDAIYSRELAKELIPLFPPSLIASHYIVATRVIPFVVINEQLSKLSPATLQAIMNQIAGADDFDNVLLFDSLWRYCKPFLNKLWPHIRKYGCRRVETIANYFAWKDYELALMRSLIHVYNNQKESASAIIRVEAAKNPGSDFWIKLFHWDELIDLLDDSGAETCFSHISIDLDRFSYEKKCKLLPWFKPQQIRDIIKNGHVDKLDDLINSYVEVDEMSMTFESFLFYIEDNWLSNSLDGSDQDALSLLISPILQQLTAANIAAAARKRELASILIKIYRHLSPLFIKVMVPMLSLDHFHALFDHCKECRDHFLILQDSVPEQAKYYLEKEILLNALEKTLLNATKTFEIMKGSTGQTDRDEQAALIQISRCRMMMSRLSVTVKHQKMFLEKIIALLSSFDPDDVDRCHVKMMSLSCNEKIDKLKRIGEDLLKLIDSLARCCTACSSPPADLVDPISGMLFHEPLRFPIESDGSGGQLIDRKSLAILVQRSSADNTPLTNPFTRRPFNVDDIITDDDCLQKVRKQLQQFRES